MSETQGSADDPYESAIFEADTGAMERLFYPVPELPMLEDAPPEVLNGMSASSATDLYGMAASILFSTGAKSLSVEGMPDYYPPELCTLFQSCFLPRTRRIGLEDFWSEFTAIARKIDGTTTT